MGFGSAPRREEVDGADAARDAIEKGLTPDDDDGDLRLAPVVAADGAHVAVPSRVIASSMAPGRSGSALGARIGARSHDASAILPVRPRVPSVIRWPQT